MSAKSRSERRFFKRVTHVRESEDWEKQYDVRFDCGHIVVLDDLPHVGAVAVCPSCAGGLAVDLDEVDYFYAPDWPVWTYDRLPGGGWSVRSSWPAADSIS